MAAKKACPACHKLPPTSPSLGTLLLIWVGLEGPTSSIVQALSPSETFSAQINPIVIPEMKMSQKS